MDRTSIIVVVVCFALIMLWSFVLMPKLYPVKPLPPGTTNALAAGVSATNEVVNAPVQPPSLEAMPATSTLTANTNVPEDLVEITNENARYTFTSRGGGLKLVELFHYPETVSTRREHREETNRLATLNAFTPAPTLALLGGDSIQGDGIFKLTKSANGNGVRAEKALSNGLTIVKDFELSTNYLVSANVRLENH
jgi:YidC/Oxa1 family membrane protein insertase